jgi:hypothetical protein
MKKKILKNKIILLIICNTIFTLFLHNIYFTYANNETNKTQNNSILMIETKQFLNKEQNNKIFSMQKQILNLEEQLMFLISQKEVVPKLKKEVDYYINSHDFKNFKLRLKIFKNEYKKENVNDYKNKKTFIKQIDILFLEFNQIKNKINEFLKQLLKKDILEEEFSKRMFYALSEKEKIFIPSEDLTLQEKMCKYKYQRDNKNALQFEQVLENYNKEIKTLQLELIFHENNLKKFKKDLNNILIKDIVSGQEINIKENLKWESFVKNNFVKNDEYRKNEKELEILYIKKQEIIQSFANAKFKLEKTKSELNYYNLKIQQLQEEYQKMGKLFVVLFGKLNNNFKNLNKFKKN